VPQCPPLCACCAVVCGSAPGSSALPRDSVSPSPLSAPDTGLGDSGDVFARISELLQFCAQTAGGYRGAQVETGASMRHSPSRGGYDTFQVTRARAEVPPVGALAPVLVLFQAPLLLMMRGWEGVWAGFCPPLLTELPLFFRAAAVTVCCCRCRRRCRCRPAAARAGPPSASWTRTRRTRTRVCPLPGRFRGPRCFAAPGRPCSAPTGAPLTAPLPPPLSLFGWCPTASRACRQSSAKVGTGSATAVGCCAPPREEAVTGAPVCRGQGCCCTVVAHG
jgi:hypothetical protein